MDIKDIGDSVEVLQATLRAHAEKRFSHSFDTMDVIIVKTGLRMGWGWNMGEDSNSPKKRPYEMVCFYLDCGEKHPIVTCVVKFHLGNPTGTGLWEISYPEFSHPKTQLWLETLRKNFEPGVTNPKIGLQLFDQLLEYIATQGKD